VEPALRLQIGDVPPPLEPMAWIKGEPIAAFERGHVYVVAYFATWCGASRQSMPLLSAFARRHAGAVTVIGINVRESERGEPTIAAVTRFVQARGRDMDYTVAMDDPLATPLFTSWMRAAGMYAIPTAFIVGRDGRLAYVGIPIDERASPTFEDALQQAVDGDSDLTAARRQHRALAEEIAHYLVDKELMRPLDAAMERKDYRAVLVEADRIVARDPARETRVFADRFVALLNIDEREALSFAQRSMQTPLGRPHAAALAGTIGGVVANQPGLSRAAYVTALEYMKTAMSAPSDAFNLIADWQVLARLHYRLGDSDEAIQAQQRALELARQRTDIPAEMMSHLETALKEYEQP
jgi:thiol-disulfide isomerase/thioredoxin